MKFLVLFVGWENLFDGRRAISDNNKHDRAIRSDPNRKFAGSIEFGVIKFRGTRSVRVINREWAN